MCKKLGIGQRVVRLSRTETFICLYRVTPGRHSLEGYDGPTWLSHQCDSHGFESHDCKNCASSGISEKISPDRQMTNVAIIGILYSLREPSREKTCHKRLKNFFYFWGYRRPGDFRVLTWRSINFVYFNNRRNKV